MSTVSLDTWISLVVLVTALSGFYLTLRREFRTEIAGLRGDLRSDIGGLRTELREGLTDARNERHALRTEVRSDIADLRTELKTDIGRLDDRVYALASGLRPRIEDSSDAS